MSRGRGSWQRARLATFMLGHFSIDLMSGLLPALYPLLALNLKLDYGAIGALALAYTAAVSLTQPLFGYLADRWGVRRLAPLSLAWSGLLLSLYGFVHHPLLLYPVAFLAGLGSGAYHPIGASRAAHLAPEQHRNTTMSVYTISGTVGYALGPLVGALLFRVFGLAGTLIALPLGLVAAVLVRWGLGRFTEASPSQRSHPAALQRTDGRALAPILAIVMLRSWTFMTVATFAPVWYREMGYEFLYGVVATVI
ncbi:MAG: MFS transporter, partial [Thermomicrobium sp.]